MKTILNLYNNYLNIYYKFAYYLHNKKNFKQENKNNKNTILIELNNYYPNHIIYSYLSNELSKKFSADIIGFPSARSIFLKDKVKNFIKKRILFGDIFIYKSFGLKNIIDLNSFFENLNYKKINKIHNLILKNISKEKILNLKIEGIYIGDLLYDDFLRKYYVATLDVKTETFLKHQIEFIKTFFLWKNYLENNNVKSVILSHAVYEMGLPLRIAQFLGIPVFIPDNYRLLRFDKKKILTLDNNLFKEINSSLNKKEKNKLIQIAKNTLRKNFSTKGEEFIEFSRMNITTKTFKNFLKQNKNFYKKKKKNILVACHCFYDSPHNFGKFFYKDFVEWLESLGKISEKTDYQWFIKKHPHSLNHKLTDRVLSKISKKYPKLKIIPEQIDNRSLKHYIDLVLTVWGSVSYEMAYLNKNVILASRPDHHKGFNFSVIPKNRKEYEKMILNLSKLKKNISKKDIYKFYYLNYLCMYDFGNLTPAKKLLKTNFYTPKIFNYWINNFNYRKHEYLSKIIKNYINGKKTLLWNKNKLLN